MDEYLSTSMAPTAEKKPEGEEDCKVCKKGKQSTAAFGALLAQRGMAIPGAATGKQTSALSLRTVASRCLAECSLRTSSRCGVIVPGDGVPVAHQFNARRGLPGR